VGLHQQDSEEWDQMGGNGQINDLGRFFSSRSCVQPGLPDLSNLSMSREAERLIQLRLAESEKWLRLLLMSIVVPLISGCWWPEHRGV
jgi:hypothetical protein